MFTIGSLLKQATCRWTTNVCLFTPFAEQYKLLTEHIDKMAAEWAWGRRRRLLFSLFYSRGQLSVVAFVWCITDCTELCHSCSKSCLSNVVVLLRTLSCISNNISSVGVYLNVFNMPVCDLLYINYKYYYILHKCLHTVQTSRGYDERLAVFSSAIQVAPANSLKLKSLMLICAVLT